MLGGCSGWQSVLDPKGPQADLLARLFWIFAAVCAIVWLIVLLALGMALVRRRQAAGNPLATNPRSERRAEYIIWLCTAVTVAVLIVLSGISFVSQHRVYAAPVGTLTLRVTGYQWWWEVLYMDPQPDRIVTTANEIHIPVDEPITLKLETNDVIHSFWAPNLAGKMDLITGRHNELTFVASRPGTYRGQCAEFCGSEHALMAMLIEAKPRDEFEAWRAKETKRAEAPRDAEQQDGQRLFMARGCMLCHTISGTPAGGRVGPDLTHMASRRYLAAGTLPLSGGNLAGWITNPQAVKPGAKMPPTKLAPHEMNALTSYLMLLN
jgi:cytochrome c oxidase subunit 2